MKCCLVQEMLSAYLDRQLTGQEMLEIDAHLGRCFACSEELAELRQVKYLLRSLGEREAAPEFSIVARLEQNRPETLTLPAPLLSRRTLAVALSCLVVFAGAAPFSPAVLELSHAAHVEHARSADFLTHESGPTLTFAAPPISLVSFPSSIRSRDDGDSRYARPYAQPGAAGLDGDPMGETSVNGYASGDLMPVSLSH